MQAEDKPGGANPPKDMAPVVAAGTATSHSNPPLSRRVTIHRNAMRAYHKDKIPKVASSSQAMGSATDKDSPKKALHAPRVSSYQAMDSGTNKDISTKALHISRTSHSSMRAFQVPSASQAMHYVTEKDSCMKPSQASRVSTTSQAMNFASDKDVLKNEVPISQIGCQSSEIRGTFKDSGYQDRSLTLTVNLTGMPSQQSVSQAMTNRPIKLSQEVMKERMRDNSGSCLREVDNSYWEKVAHSGVATGPHNEGLRVSSHGPQACAYNASTDISAKKRNLGFIESPTRTWKKRQFSGQEATPEVFIDGRSSVSRKHNDLTSAHGGIASKNCKQDLQNSDHDRQGCGNKTQIPPRDSNVPSNFVNNYVPYRQASSNRSGPCLKKVPDVPDNILLEKLEPGGEVHFNTHKNSEKRTLGESSEDVPTIDSKKPRITETCAESTHSAAAQSVPFESKMEIHTSKQKSRANTILYGDAKGVQMIDDKRSIITETSAIRKALNTVEDVHKISKGTTQITETSNTTAEDRTRMTERYPKTMCSVETDNVPEKIGSVSKVTDTLSGLKVTGEGLEGLSLDKSTYALEDVNQSSAAAHSLEKSLLDELEKSLAEGNCERAREMLAAWKTSFKGETQKEGEKHSFPKEGNEYKMLLDIPGKRKGLIVSPDISRGLEKLPISCVNEYNAEVLPEDFLYITSSVISAAAHVDISFSRIGDLHCNCSGDCLESSEACRCTDSTRGEYAYTEEGLLIQRLATSIQSRYATENGDFITECCAKCRCSKQCGNRVVQRGITRRLQVFMTPSKKGWGVRALEKIPARSFVFEYIGEIATNQEQYLRNMEYERNGVHTYTMDLNADFDMEQRHFGEGLNDEELLVLDATMFGNVARFVNHRCHDANLFIRPVQIETRDTHYYHVAFFAARDIDIMEELTWDYGIDFSDARHPVKAFRCRCNSTYCRDKPKKKKAVKSNFVK